jgi:2-polyprenyl-3-methyl-5-hydroxy-6-metoxy-1,4-benzoquinol methylase
MSRRDWHEYWNRIFIKERIDQEEALRQVGKTVMGTPVPLEQIVLLTDHIRTILRLTSADRAIDLGCGNGLITSRIAPYIGEVLGIDYSKPLLDVAASHFKGDNIDYALGDVSCLDPDAVPFGHYTKVWSCELLQHLDPVILERLLFYLGKRLADGYAILFCGIPNKDELRAFYNTNERWKLYEKNVSLGREQIGYWWEFQELYKAAHAAGMTIQIIDQPTGLYTSHYRFDALFEKNE